MKNPLLIIIITCLITVFGTSLTLEYFFKQHIQKLKLELVTKEKIIKNSDTRILELNQKINSTYMALENLKRQDNNTKLLINDIEKYILSNYQRVPKTVAKTIAVELVKETSKENIAPEIILGIIEVESSFNPSATGIKTKYGHARGLMQVMPEWVKKFDLKDNFELYDIDTNIMSGIKVFKIHLKEADNNISKGLYYYVNRDKAYVNKVFTAMGKFVSYRSTDIKKVEDESNKKTNENNTTK